MTSSGDGDGDSTTATTTTATTTTATTTTGDGDGDGTATATGDGDGTLPPNCGWGQTGDPNLPEGYVCGAMGADPSGTSPIACPSAGLVDGGDCTGVTDGIGCCDANGDLWYCGTDGTNDALTTQAC
jgi:hypothetical protein